MGTAQTAPAARLALITAARLIAFAPNMAEDVAEQLAPALEVEAERCDITTPLRLAHFMAQAFVESWGFTRFSENLNYSAAGLRATFPSHFTDGAHAEHYAHNPEAIANRVYAGRFGNGDEASGDGFRFRGRGLLGRTFRDNYETAEADTGLDLVEDPDQLHLVGEPMAKDACDYWRVRDINAAADADDVEAVTHLVNGGLNGLADREAALRRARRIFVEAAAETEVAA